MKVLILGCGYTGGRLARWLLAKQVAVEVTTQTGVPPMAVQAPSYAFTWATGKQPLPLDPVALAGVTHVLSTIPPDQQGMDPVVASLLPRLEAAGLVWFGYLSTTGVYGDTGGSLGG